MRVVCDQLVPVRVNTYAAPARPGWAQKAPTTAMFPRTATEQPKFALPAPSEASSTAWSVHVVPLRTKT